MDAANGVLQVAAADAAAVGAVPAALAVPLLLMLLLLLLLLLLLVTAAFVHGGHGACTLDGPAAWPVVGTMHAMRGHRHRPFRRFTELARQYGPVYLMRMGATPCVVVNDYASIREVLIGNGSKFGGRLDFARYHALFAGDRNNSLALCDWSTLQETRRRIARMFCSPKVCSSNYGLLDSIASDELDALLVALAAATGLTAAHGTEPPRPVQVKPLLLIACANMFMRFMCSQRFEYDDRRFRAVVRTFDRIFHDINQSYALDFLPWLKPFYRGHLNDLAGWSADVRRFIMDAIVSKRENYNAIVSATGNGRDDEREPDDFTDALLMSLQRDEPELNMDHILFELEDFIGGHSAVGNLVMIALSMVATRPHVARRIREEADRVTGGGQRPVRLYDKPDMPYTEATLFETLRMVSSPIVPRVATEDAVIAGHKIPKGTGVIINNYELNTSPVYWDNPEAFEPDRFVRRGHDAKPCIRKPEYFLPFSTGKRTCIGQQLVSGFGFVSLAGILQRYDVSATDQLSIPETSLSLPPDTHPLILKPLNGSR